MLPTRAQWAAGEVVMLEVASVVAEVDCLEDLQHWAELLASVFQESPEVAFVGELQSELETVQDLEHHCVNPCPGYQDCVETYLTASLPSRAVFVEVVLLESHPRSA